MPVAHQLHVFLNYRREETSGHAGRLFDMLAARFGADNVFMDIDRIEPGLDFADVISEAVASSDVLISLIGSRWLTSPDAKGRPRLENPEDFVRLELEAALELDVRVIPALVQNAQMPSSDELPETLRPFARRNAVELSDTRWTFDVGKLIEALERLETGLAGREEADREKSQREARARAEAEAQGVAERAEVVSGPVSNQRQLGQERLINGLEARSFRTHPGSDRSWYHPSLPDFRVVLQKTSFRLEVRNRSGHGRPWQAQDQLGPDGTVIRHPGGAILDYRAADEGLAQIDEHLRD